MDSICKFATFYFILISSSSTQFKVTSPNLEAVIKYEPLYVVDKIARYATVNLMTFDEQSRKHVLVAPEGYDIEQACPKKDQDDGSVILEVVDDKPVARKIKVGVVCSKPVKPYVQKFPHSDHYSVGFLLYKEEGFYKALNLHEDLPQTDNLITSMVVNFERTESRPTYVWYTIEFGEWIEIEPSEPINGIGYEKNLEIYGFDVDKVYSKDHQESIFASEFNMPLPSLLIKMQLAPAEDFLLQNYKTMSRMNLNTAPVWQTLLPQWRSLEKFVRKVARILGRLSISTGAFDMLLLPKTGADYKPIYLENTLKMLTVPKFIWKTVISRYGEYTDPNTNYGILFIMHNHPYSGLPHLKQNPLCENIIDETGWGLYTQQPGGVASSQIYACELTQANLNLVEGGTIPIQVYRMFNLYNVKKSYYEDDDFTQKIVEPIDVIEELRDKGLL